jgi:hypothetical protein
MQKIAIEGAYLFKTGRSILYIPGEIYWRTVSDYRLYIIYQYVLNVGQGVTF